MAIVCLQCGASRPVPLSFTLPGGEDAIVPGENAPLWRPIAICVECGTWLYPGELVTSVPSPDGSQLD